MRRIPLLIGLAVTATAAHPARAAAQAPPGPPGPPPGSGANLPSSPGTALSFVPPGVPMNVPPATGPGLLRDTNARLDDRRFTLRFACQRDGALQVRAPRIAPRAIAATRFRCVNQRATARLTVSTRSARRIARRSSVAATAVIDRARLHFTLTSRRRAAAVKGFWTDGHLQCDPGFLVEPDFTTKAATPVSTRGWVAVYTAATGWHWFGTLGENRGRWNAWTATRTGIAQFHPDASVTPVPWTLGPISVPPGSGRYAVGVYEIVYWVGGRADHQWQYVNAGTTGAVAAGSPTHYCVYP
ncbi:hypothetical protein DVA67_026340 [Solirubrobacter sp. CPCC 204708]|uniref:Uncharacterized protein n=1 Tax=Solirubrobacter deserti TaxID=2282478 RepID=A0ABT4RF66_9ACTN|nr:hypothetical protein [Solirubrobacter deserti]MBE2319514.1 hypothetical protein [Solirubrobacter deserti]MDA0137199.1 hypothetical protein [Solirubrobacter deserti]